MKNRAVIEILCLILPVILRTGGIIIYAQDKGCKLSGRVICENPPGKIFTVEHARLVLTEKKDTLLTWSLNDGFFVFSGLHQGTAELHVFHASYDSFETSVELEEGDNFCLIKLDLTALNAASVVSEAPLVTHRKDTTIFNGVAVITMEGDSAIEILRQMPGVEIRSGKVYVDGQLVKRTYVNGHLIYGNGVMTPLESLLAEEVVNIKSYEEEPPQARQRGLKNSMKERVLDITTKTPVFSAFDGYIASSAGADAAKDIGGNIQGRYLAGLNANFFSEMLLAYFTGYANNVGWDANSFSSYSELPGALKDYREKASVQTGIEKYWGNRLLPTMLRVSYSFDNEYKRNASFTSRDYLETEYSPSRSLNDTLSSSDTDKRHIVNLFFSSNTDAAGTIYSDNTLSFYNSENYNLRNSSLTSSGGTPYMQSNSQGETGTLRNLESHNFWLKNNFDSGFCPLVNLDIYLGNQVEDGITVDTLSSTFTKKHLWTTGNGKNYKVETGVTLKKAVVNTQSMTLDVHAGYGYTRQHISKHRLSLDILNPDDPVTDIVNSFDYNWDVSRHGPNLEASMHSRHGHFTMEAGLYFNHMSDKEAFPSTDVSRYFFIIPQASVFYHSADKRIRASIDFSGELPALEQLRDRLDDRNPFYLRAGNPTLKPQGRINMNTAFALLKKGNRRLSLEGNCNFLTNPIIYRQSFFSSDAHLDRWGGYDIKAGSSLTTYENAPVSMSLTPQMNYSVRVQKARMNYSASLGAKISMRPQYVTDNLVNMAEMAPWLSHKLGYAPSSITRVSLMHRLSYVHSFNSLGQSMPDIITNQISFSSRIIFLKRCLARIDYSFYANNYPDDSYPDVYLGGLDVLLSVTFLKGRLGLSISGNDLFNRGSSFTYTAEANYNEMAWTPSFGRYFMFSIVYRLNKTSPQKTFIGMLR